MSTYPKYKLVSSSLRIECETAWSENDINGIATGILTAWTARQLPVDSTAEQVRLGATLKRKTEGKSGADVYELAFRKTSTKVAPPLVKFIVRSINGPNAADLANAEREFARHLGASMLDLFSCSLVDFVPSLPNVVVYQHADMELGESTNQVSRAIQTILEGRDDSAVTEMARHLQRLGPPLEAAWDLLGTSVRMKEGNDYAAQVRDRLGPDILLSAQSGISNYGTDKLLLTTATNDAPHDPSQVAQVTPEGLMTALLSDEVLNYGWSRIRVCVPPLSMSTVGLLKFVADDIHIWVQTGGTVSLPDGFAEGAYYELLFRNEGRNVELGTRSLERLGFGPDACLLPNDFVEICSHLRSRINLVRRHTDLHANNILYAGSGMKIVDVGSIGYDLPAVGLARLELSIFAHALAKVDIGIDDVETLLRQLEDGTSPDQSSMSWEAWALTTIISALRQGMGFDAMRRGAWQDTVLAYATQVLLHQRYIFEEAQQLTNEAITERDNQGKGRRRTSEAFSAICRYWLQHLQRITAGADAALTLPDPPTPTEAATETVLTIADGTPTLSILWHEAMKSTPYGIVGASAEEFITSIQSANPEFLYSPLTELQQELLNKNDVEKVFQSDLHVVISGPTSSGKSTIADMFLARTAILNERKRCALYIAPTRALTQAKYRELLALCQDNQDFADGIVLSTSEDADHDRRIIHGDFKIACMVYEKANILFSMNRRLLSKLGCVVVDEIHMLTDIERGPILEMVLTKALVERTNNDARTGRDPRREAIRVIAISTEDAPDPSFVRFLSVHDADTGMSIDPIFVSSQSRPVTVQHTLVLQSSTDPGFSLFDFLAYSSSEGRRIQPPELQKLGRQLRPLTANAKTSSTYLPAGQELKTRLNELLVHLITNNPRGYRVLVFVPSRAMAEDEARRLRNKLGRLTATSRYQQIGQKFQHEELVERLRPHLDRAENQRLAEILLTCAESGILVHHSDVDKRIRCEMESICSSMSPMARSQVIFATETLSYGVNLAVQDVVVCGVEFHTQDRFRVHMVERLSSSAYHNMVGRAGRLGKNKMGPGTHNIPHVYVIPHSAEEAFGIIADYYTSVVPTESMLYVRDDRDKQLEAERNPFIELTDEDNPCAKYRGLGASSFSYPFVRSILDGLRHLNMGKRASSSGSAASVGIDEVLNLFGRTLYSQQHLWGADVSRERLLFPCAVGRILDDAANAPLHLVDASDTGRRVYAITPRGEAIIDTGTEIHTVQPLLTLVQALHSVWKRCQGTQPFPADLYLISLIAQKETFRNYIHYAAECKGVNRQKEWPRQLAENNRDNMLLAFASALQKVDAFTGDEAMALAEEIRNVLDDWEPSRTAGECYPGGATDSLLRFFCGLIAWINGEELAVVENLIEGVELAEGYRGHLQGFRQFTEQLNMKAVFLAKMLASDKHNDPPFGPDEERSLHTLATRLRLGCVAEAIPLFWPFSSDFLRREAVRIMAAGATPTKLLRMKCHDEVIKNTVDLAPARLHELCGDLERFAKKEFRELVLEMIESTAMGTRREAIQSMWKDTQDVFETSINEYRGSQIPTASVDRIFRRWLDFRNLDVDEDSMAKHLLNSPGHSSLDDDFEVSVDVPQHDAGMWFYGRRQSRTVVEASMRASFTPQIPIGVRVIGIQFRGDWFCAVDGDEWMPFDRFLKLFDDVPNLVLVPTPWLPSRAELPERAYTTLSRRASLAEYSTTVITLPAFNTMVTAVVRDLLSGEALLGALIKPPDHHDTLRVYTVAAVQKMLDAVPNRLIPPPIRERLINHFEVEP